MRLKRNAVTVVGAVVFTIAWVNSVAYWSVAVAIGGDAFSGKVENGHYFLSSHGRLTEVSPDVWRYSRIHTVSTWVVHPVGIVVGCGLMWLGQKRAKAA